MRKSIRLIAAAMMTGAAIIPATAQTEAPYTLDVKDFSELKVKHSVNVNYVCSQDSAGKVLFTATPQVAPMVMFSNDKNRLTIELAPEAADLKGKGLPTVTVYSSMLQKVENSGDSTVRALKLAPVPQLKLTVVGNGTIVANDVKAHEVSASINTGSGHIVIDGTANRANLQNIGVGPLEAGLLKAEDVKCKMLGTGPIDCYASESLKIMGMGSGKVIYDGNPKKVTNRGLGVKVIDLNAKPEEEKTEK